MKNVKKVGRYDEKIFLYYDETDFCLRAYRKNQKIYVLPKIKVKHQGGMSVNLNNKLSIEANKHWHYMWSKFYYYKKNYTYLRGIKETIIQFIKAIIKLSFYYFVKRNKFLIYKNRASGLFNSYINKSSWRRPNI